jgi:hypothetical protein
MIQRIQTLWLFLAAMCNGLLFIFPLYKFSQLTNPNAWQFEGVRNHLPLLVCACVVTLLPLVSVFFFRDRKKQKSMVGVSIFSIFAFLGLVFMRTGNIKNATPPPANFEWVIPGVLVVFAALIFLVLAMRGIRRDEALIKSLDRLR